MGRIQTSSIHITSTAAYMADNDPLELRLKFLKQAAHLLAVPSPTTAAEIGAAHDRLVATGDGDMNMSKKDWDALRREICGACGNVMVPGWSCHVSYRSQRHQKPKSLTAPSTRTQKSIEYHCRRCDSKTFQPLQTRPAKHTTRLKPASIHTTTVMAESNEEPSKTVKSANATSKLRKKARKGGLQATLEKNKIQTSGKGRLGLDLMDFMGP